MLQDTSLQKLADLIQVYEIAEAIAISLYEDPRLKDWAKWAHALDTKVKVSDIKKKLRAEAGLDYDSEEAKTKIIKQGSTVEVLVGHMDGMKGSTATIKSYSLPAMMSNITMKDGMKMNNHKWLTNDEVKLV